MMGFIKNRSLKNLNPSVQGKPSLLFVDHVYHKKTRSSDFLVEILSAEFEVNWVYVDPSRTPPAELASDPAEYVLIWQMDYLTPLFVAAGKKVTVAQMYDGSAWLPDAHYTLNAQVQYLNFSLALHVRALSHGLRSHLVQYFPDPGDFTPVEDFSSLRAFFWQRMPGSNINVERISHMLGSQLDSIHVHTPADDGTPFDPELLDGFNCEVSTSDWFDKKSDFTATLERCNVFIAPRYGEGIGMAFLEAMARGMVVLAHDLPTHNEYINNWDTGILFSNQVTKINLRSREVPLQKISENARLAVLQGHALWQKAAPGIRQFVRDAKSASVPEVAGLMQGINGIIAAYQNGPAVYSEVLARHPELCAVMGKWDELEREVSELSGGDLGQLRSTENTVLIFFGHGGATPFLGKGWSDSEATHIWAVDRSAGIQVPINSRCGPRRLTLEVRGLIECQIEVILNGISCGVINLDAVFERHHLDLPESSGKLLDFEFRVAGDIQFPQVEVRPLTFAMKSLALNLES